MDLTEVKSLLKTYCKQNHYKSPKYKIVFITDSEYQKLYTISVEIKDVLKVADSAISRRIAEKKAAIKALVQLKVINKEDADKTEDKDLVKDTNDDTNVKPVVKEQPIKPQPKIIAKEKVVNRNTENELDPIVKVTVNEVSDNTKNIVLSKPLKKVPKTGNDMKFIDENNFSKPKKTQNLVTNQSKGQTTAQNNEQHLRNNLKNEYLTELDENPICGLIKYCLRNGIPLPFYDFNFIEGQFSTQCRVESNGTEFVGFGRSSTLREAKMIASQEVIDELKNVNLYSSGDQKKEPVVVESGYNIQSTGNNEYTEYSTLTINMKSKNEKKIENNSPKKENFDDFEEFDRKNHSSTFSSRDDNNNPKDSRFNTSERSVERSYSLIIENPISYLQKYCSKNKLTVPTYAEEARTGPDHCPLFWYKCTMDNKDDETLIGVGGGNSKKSAKKAAAEEVVRLLLNL